MLLKFRLLPILGIFLISSCIPYKDIVFMRSKDKSYKDSIIFQNSYLNYKIQPGDVIDIKVSSLDPQSVAIFNKNVGDNRPNQVNEASVFLNGYSVNDSGYVSLPIIGNVYLKDLEISKVKTVIEDQMKSYYKFSSVDIKLMNFKVTVLGEVLHQGSFTVYRDQINILQVLGMAGGFTDLADKKRVKILRKEGEQTKTFYLDMRDSEFINSHYYYIHPNDVIYVEPLKVKMVKVNAPTVQIILSALTFVIVVANLLRK